MEAAGKGGGGGGGETSAILSGVVKYYVKSCEKSLFIIKVDALTINKTEKTWQACIPCIHNINT